MWLIKQYPILKDSQIAKLVGITKNSVTLIRKKSYWNYNNLNAKDPVAMGLFNQIDLVEAIEKAEKNKREKKKKKKLKNKKNQFNGQLILKMIVKFLFWEVVIKIEVKDNNVEQALRVLKKTSERWFF